MSPARASASSLVLLALALFGLRERRRRVKRQARSAAERRPL
jgi:hypothetical protein